MMRMTYPGLYHEADTASNSKQSSFLKLIRLEYAALFVAAVFSMDWSQSVWYYVIYALIFIAPFALLMVRSFSKPEQGWYQSRALAESIKTSSWKYVMRAKPFEGEYDINVARANFRNHLRLIFDTNRSIGHQFTSEAAEMEQITPEMDGVRALPLEDRIAIYMSERIESQRKWYAKKAFLNRKWARLTVSGLVFLYFFAAVMVLIRIAEPSWKADHAEPIVVLASGLIGWMQIKKYNELAVSYNLTAIEIGIIKSESLDGFDDGNFSKFVDDAEQAFSREHTQWVARQST